MNDSLYHPGDYVKIEWDSDLNKDKKSSFTDFYKVIGVYVSNYNENLMFDNIYDNSTSYIYLLYSVEHKVCVKVQEDIIRSLSDNENKFITLLYG